MKCDVSYSSEVKQMDCLRRDLYGADGRRELCDGGHGVIGHLLSG